jgi:uncharacterized membrane protein YqjE
MASPGQGASRQTANFEAPRSGTTRFSTFRLLLRIGETIRTLVHTEVQLAKAEIKADLRSELAMLIWLAVGAVSALLGLNLVLVAAVLAVAQDGTQPWWTIALRGAGILFLIAAGAGLIGWSKRVKAPLAKTRKSLSEDFP